MSKRSNSAKLYRAALAHHQAGRLHEAEALYRSILSSEPKHAMALHYLGVIAHQAGYHEAAAELIGQALAIAPDYAEAISNYGLVMIALGRSTEATTYFTRAIRLKPDYAEAHYNIGIAHDERGEFQAAADSYGVAIRLRPGYVDAHCNLGIALHALGRYDEACASYRRALALAPGLTRLHTYLGFALYQQGFYEEAITAYRNGIAAAPADPATYQCLADALYAINDLSAATKALETGLRCLGAAGAPAASVSHPPVIHGSSGGDFAALRAVQNLLNASGIECFLISGTLLAAIRDGDFIAYDKDMDFGVWESVSIEDLDRALAVDAADSDFKRENINGDGSEAYCATYRWRNTVAIDFFRLFAADCKMWYGLAHCDHAIKWLHRPFDLVERDWRGVVVKTPRDPEYFLAEDYGPHWREPDPYFGIFASPNIEGGFTLACRFRAYYAVFIALWRRDRRKAMRLCEQILALDPGNDAVAGIHRDLMTAQGQATPRQQTKSETAIEAHFGAAYDRLPG